jgi:acyl-CoA synthetase (NDP forming)
MQEQRMRDIKPLVAPRSIAVIGASANPTKSGGVLFDNLVKGNFKGPLYPINRTAAEIMGRRAYPALAEVPSTAGMRSSAGPRTSRVRIFRCSRRRGRVRVRFR